MGFGAYHSGVQALSTPPLCRAPSTSLALPVPVHPASLSAPVVSAVSDAQIGTTEYAFGSHNSPGRTGVWSGLPREVSQPRPQTRALPAHQMNHTRRRNAYRSITMQLHLVK